MLTVGTSALSETAVETNVILCLHSSHAACLICLSLRQRIPFLASVVLFWAALEVWAMSELACGVTLVFTVSPLPFPFLSFFELPLGTSAMSFYKGKETHLFKLAASFQSDTCDQTSFGFVWAPLPNPCVPCQFPVLSSGQLSSLL